MKSGKLNKIIKVLLIVLFSVFNVICSFYLCEKILDWRHFQKKISFLDFAINGKNDFFTIDRELIYKIDKLENYRNYHVNSTKTKNIVAMIGDSVTFGNDVKADVTYPIQTENITNKSIKDNPIHVMNFGVPGYSIDQEYLLAKNYIIPNFHPKYIVWNVNANDIWDTNFMCLFSGNSENPTKLPGTYNISYWYGYAGTKLPRIITDSKTFNFVWQFVYDRITNFVGEDRYTIGCTKRHELFIEDKESIADRLVHFANTLNNELLLNDGKLILTLVPYQKYFDINSKYNELDQSFFILQQSVNNSKLTFIDFNKKILEHQQPSLYSQRISLPNPKKDSTIYSENLAETYFLDGALDEAPFGWRHPNEKLYNLMAQEIVNLLP